MRTLPLILALTACLPDPRLQELEDRRVQWADREAASYTWTVQELCFCPDADPIEVAVVDGEVASATRLPPDASPVVLDPADYQDWFTVEGMFAKAEDAILRADEILALTYDADAGYPTALEVDWITDAIDDEASWYGSDLVVEGSEAGTD